MSYLIITTLFPNKKKPRHPKVSNFNNPIVMEIKFKRKIVVKLKLTQEQVAYLYNLRTSDYRQQDSTISSLYGILEESDYAKITYL